jgi:hypothetical protein
MGWNAGNKIELYQPDTIDYFAPQASSKGVTLLYTNHLSREPSCYSRGQHIQFCFLYAKRSLKGQRRKCNTGTQSPIKASINTMPYRDEMASLLVAWIFSQLWAQMILRRESRANFRLLSVLRNEGERRDWRNLAEQSYSTTSVLRQVEVKHKLQYFMQVSSSTGMLKERSMRTYSGEDHP